MLLQYVNGAQFNWLSSNRTVIGGSFLVCALGHYAFDRDPWESRYSERSGNMRPAVYTYTNGWWCTVVQASEGDLLRGLGRQLVVLHSPLLDQQLAQTFSDKSWPTFDPKNVFQDILHLRHHSLCQVIPCSGGISNQIPILLDQWSCHIWPIMDVSCSLGRKQRSWQTCCWLPPWWTRSGPTMGRRRQPPGLGPSMWATSPTTSMTSSLGTRPEKTSSQISAFRFHSCLYLFAKIQAILRNWNNCSWHIMWLATSAVTWFGRSRTINKLTRLYAFQCLCRNLFCLSLEHFLPKDPTNSDFTPFLWLEFSAAGT